MARMKPRQHSRMLLSPRFRRKRGKTITVNRGIKRLDFPIKKANNRFHATIFVPSTTKFDRPVSKKRFETRIDNTVDFMNKKFGGATRTPAQGSFKLENGKIVEEPVVKVETFATKKDYFKHDRELKSFLLKKKKKWGQESIGFGFESSENPDESIHFV